MDRAALNARYHARRHKHDLLYRLRRVLNAARHRCAPDSKSDYYRGLPVTITIDELCRLWWRDKAWRQDKPSLDRKDSKGGYTYQNCRFIPMSDNISRAVQGRDELKKAASLRATVALRPLRTCSKHPERKAKCKGLCDSCYQMKWRKNA